MNIKKFSAKSRVLRFSLIIEMIVMALTVIGVLMFESQNGRGAYWFTSLFGVFLLPFFLLFLKLFLDITEIDEIVANLSLYVVKGLFVFEHGFIILWLTTSDYMKPFRIQWGHFSDNYLVPAVTMTALVIEILLGVGLVYFLSYQVVKWGVWNGQANNFVALTRKGNIKRINLLPDVDLADDTDIKTIGYIVHDRHEEIVKNLRWWQLH